MKRIYNYMLFAAFSVAIASCNNEELAPNKPSAESGDDVQFGLTLGDPETKTVYGDEDNDAYPIYWINGDKVQIFSPQCLEGRRSAEYAVSVSEPRKYAEALNKTGEYGVQWGDNDNAIFYSLYPSGAYTLSSDGKEAQGITINYSQNIVVNGNEVKSDMEDCLMYAKNDGGEDNEYKGVPRGQTVNLKYTPISTVFMVTLKVASSSADDFTIQSVSLVAPSLTHIAGTFSLNISDGSFGKFADSKSSNSVSTQISDKTTGGFYTLAKGKDVTIPLFLAPVKELNTDGWKIIVKANNKEYTKTLTSQNVAAGKIHKVVLPSLSTIATEWETGNWMQNIPRNVYLSEVSLPGSWNTLNPEFQGSSPTIAAQYTAGVRAFHLDTRWASTTAPGKTWYESILGDTIDDYYQKSNLNSGNMYLSVADGTGGHHVRASNSATSDSYGQVAKQNNTSFATYLSQITGKVSESEYMVLICSFAQESFEDVSVTGQTWIQAITEACSKDSKVYDARKITKSTLVGDVLGSVIVIVNAIEAITESTSLPKDSKCLFMYLPSELTSDHFPATGYNKDVLWISTTDKEGAIITKSTGLNVYNSQTQITSNTGSGYTTDRGYAPALSERTNVLNNILNWSKSNYAKEDYAHDMWIYLGLGGYQMNSNSNQVSNSHSVIAKEYNNWINDRIIQMGTGDEGNKTPYYPVGIVLMNFTTDNTTNISNVSNTTLTTAAVVKNILLLNNRYQLQYDPNKPSDYNPNAKTRSAAPSYSSGMNDSDVAAFGWD